MTEFHPSSAPLRRRGPKTTWGIRRALTPLGDGELLLRVNELHPGGDSSIVVVEEIRYYRARFGGWGHKNYSFGGREKFGGTCGSDKDLGLRVCARIGWGGRPGFCRCSPASCAGSGPRGKLQHRRAILRLVSIRSTQDKLNGAPPAIKCRMRPIPRIAKPEPFRSFMGTIESPFRSLFLTISV